MRSLLLDFRGPPRQKDEEVMEYIKKWTQRGLQVYDFGTVPVQGCPLYEFMKFVPDPIVH